MKCILYATRRYRLSQYIICHHQQRDGGEFPDDELRQGTARRAVDAR